jgi:hypothetical protein
MASTPTPGWSRRDLYWILALTVLIEAVTCLFRFGLGLESTRDTGTLGRWTFGLRIHHGYVGLLLAGLSLLLPRGTFLRTWGLRIGLALVASDLCHHFLILWPLTGNPSLDLVYPD